MKNCASILCFFWPGSKGVLRYGLWDQLGLALFFGLLCNATFFLCFFWEDFLSNFAKLTLGGALLFAWLALNCVASSKLKKYERTRTADGKSEAFLEAQTHYLRGNWFETETCLKAMLKINPYDAEALLLLATLYRRLKRFAEAKRNLTALEKLDAADYWIYEIALEKNALTLEEKEEVAPKQRLDERNETEEVKVEAVAEKAA